MTNIKQNNSNIVTYVCFECVSIGADYAVANVMIYIYISNIIASERSLFSGFPRINSFPYSNSTTHRGPSAFGPSVF